VNLLARTEVDGEGQNGFGLYRILGRPQSFGSQADRLPKAKKGRLGQTHAGVPIGRTWGVEVAGNTGLGDIRKGDGRLGKADLFRKTLYLLPQF